MTRDGDGFSLECEEGQFYVHGAARTEMMTELEITLEYVWRAFVEGDVSEMSDGALSYRRWLSERMRRAEHPADASPPGPG